MGFSTKIIGEYEHEFNVGDHILWTNDKTGKQEELIVGDDWESLERWGDCHNYIITTNGRVLSIREITKK